MSEEVQPLGAYLAEVRSARAADYAHLGVTPEEFERMRRYLLESYRGTDVVRSVRDADGVVFDYIREATGRGSEASAPPAFITESGEASPASRAPEDRRGGPPTCPPGTFARRRLSMETLASFGSVDAYLAKAPGGGVHPLSGRGDP